MKFVLSVEHPAMDDATFCGALPAALRSLAKVIESPDSIPRKGHAMAGVNDGPEFRLQWHLTNEETHQ